jgi:hypothetical protein
MPQITADQIIGKTLFAAKTLDKLNASLQKTGTFKPGESVGVVYSYITRNGQVHWMFYDSFGKAYYIKHTADSFKFSKDIQNALQQQQMKEEKEIIAQKGAVPYYIEKYGKYVLIAFVGLALIKTFYKKN